MGVALLTVIIATGYRKGFSCVAQQCLDRQPPAGIFLYGTGLQFYRGSVLQDVGSAWIFFLLAITSVPEVPNPTIPEVSDPDGEERAGLSICRRFAQQIIRKEIPVQTNWQVFEANEGSMLLSPKNSPGSCHF